MKKLPDHWYLRVTFALLAGWTALVYFWLGRVVNRGYGDAGEEHVTPGAAVWLAGIAGVFWLLSYLFDVTPKEGESSGPEDPNIG